MNYYFFNTDSPSMAGQRRFPILIQKGFAATSGPHSFGEQLGTLTPDDILLMYENQVGVVAVGTVLEHWDGQTHSNPLYYLPGDNGFDHEYRIKVNWFLDLSENPITVDELKRRGTSTPRGAIRRIVKWRAEVESMIDERRVTAGLTRKVNELAAAPVNINRFFTDTLGANLRNARWSWGAVDPMTNRVFLRVWQDNVETLNDGERVLVAVDEPKRNSNGFAERHAHIAQIENGAEGFGVVCKAVDPDTKEVRTIADFDHINLLRLGVFTKENGDTYARIDARIPVAQLIRRRTAQSTLTEDIRTLERRRIEPTTKETMVSARVGQGAFRTKVLRSWGHRCSVTRSSTLDAIRASHIKPWRESTDEERLDPENGLPLVAGLDALFDAGLISFGSSGEMIVSPKLDTAERQIFGIGEDSLTKKPSAQMAKYLTYHRSDVFCK